MKLVRSNSPEVARRIASARTRASRYLPAFVYGLFVNVLILLTVLVASLTISMWAAVWLGVPVLLAWNTYVLWLTKSSNRNWCIAVCAEGAYIRLGINNPEVIMLEACEIASMSIRTTKVFLFGPKPKSVEWLVIESTKSLAENDHVLSLLEGSKVLGPDNLVHVTNEGGRLIIGWKWCHPVLQIFLQQLIKELPSIVIAPEERSELDLNGIWHGISLDLDAQKRQLLGQAKRLGFGSKCKWLLCRYKYISFQRAAAYLEEIEQEEAGTENSAVQQ
jgi:hypothetical protein